MSEKNILSTKFF